MLFRVSGAGFKQVIQNVAGTGAKKPINLTFKNGKLRVQSSSIVIVEESMPILESDADYESFSTTMNNTIELINPDEVLNIVVSGDTMTLMQSTLNYTVVREYIEAIEYNQEKSEKVLINIGQLNNVLKDVRAIELVTKTLGKEAFAIYVKDGMCYVDGQCIAYEAPLSLPDVGITNKVIKELSRVCKGSAEAFTSDNVLTIHSGDKRILVTTDIVDRQHVNVLKTLSDGMKLIVKDFDISSYNATLEVFLKVYSNSLVNVIIGNDGLTLYLDNGEVKVVAGKQVERLCSIQLSMQQAVCMSHVMGSLGGIDIYGGNNKICLVQKNSNKKLTLAGTLY